MSPRRKHSGGRPRSANSVLTLAERWGISEKSARRLAALSLPDDAMAILVAESKRYRAAQQRLTPSHGKYIGGMAALGMKSRVPAARTGKGGCV
jgi:hypothetical protein